jgi:hypothetical protein
MFRASRFNVPSLAGGGKAKRIFNPRRPRNRKSNIEDEDDDEDEHQ